MSDNFDPDKWGEPGRVGKLIAESAEQRRIVSVGADEDGKWVANYVEDLP